MERSPRKLQGSDKMRERRSDSAGSREDNKERQRVTFAAGDITVVRRPGEGSRPLFDRDEIINHERMSDEERRGGHRHSSSQSDTDVGERRRGYDPQRIRSSYRERPRRERLCGRCGRRCPTCRRYSTCFSDDEDTYGNHRGGRLYRTRSDEIMLLDHPYLYRERYPSEICYYHFEDPGYYEVVGNLILHPALSYGYFAGCEY